MQFTNDTLRPAGENMGTGSGRTGEHVRTRRTGPLPVPIVSPRRGFTLFELLVVMGIMLSLAGLLVLGGLSYGDQKRVSSTADQLQQYLLIAKSRAKRDKAPRGIRFLVNAQTNLCNQLLYVGDQPDWNGGITSSFSIGWEWSPANAQGRPIDGKSIPVYRAHGLGLANFGPFDQADRSNPQTAPHRDAWAIQSGYYLELYGGGLANRITNFSDLRPNLVQPGTVDVVLDLTGPNVTWTPWTAANPYGLPNYPDYPNLAQSKPTAQYRIIRTPMPIQGEEPIQLADATAIDFNTNSTFGNPIDASKVTGGVYQVDILFSPTGAVTNWRLGTDKIILWVRDTSQPGSGPAGLAQPWDVEPHLITVFTRTGLIASYPIDRTPISAATAQQLKLDPTTPIDPYSLTRSGESSGL